MTRRIEHHEHHVISAGPSGIVHRTTAVTVSSDDGPADADAVDAAGLQHPATDGDCFDIDCCDAREQALIKTLRAYLRPQSAPECLIARLHRCLQDGRRHSGPSDANDTDAE